MALCISRDPTSAFFTPAQGYERRYSLQREREGNAFIDAVKDSTSVRAPPKNPLMCLGITTVQRDGHQYIRPAIGSLLDGLEKTQRDQVHLMVFIAQTDPKSHPAYDQGWLRAVSNEILEYDVDDVELARLRSLEEEHLYWNKSGYDYAYILDKCAATGASWVVIVEDDTVAAKGWYPRALEALNAISKSQSDWIYLRMFYTEKLLGWNSESWVFYLAISISLFAGFIGLLWASYSASRRFRKFVTRVDLYVLCLFWFPAGVTLYFMAGKHSMQPPPEGLHKMQHFGCCTQGLIFPLEMVPRAIHAIQTADNPRYYVDLTLERWADAQGLIRYALTSPLLQHIGGRSSKGSSFDEGAASIWSFAFEELHVIRSVVAI
ncbi:MAG: hypothetical protein Q9190_000747 [Brigantiaea leucoxantha]